LRHLKPVLGDLEPAFLVERVDGPFGLLPAFVGILSELVCLGNHVATSALFWLKPARALAAPGPQPPCSAFGSATESRRSRRFHRGTGGTAEACSRLADFVGRSPATRLIGLAPNKALVGLVCPFVRYATNGGKMRMVPSNTSNSPPHLYFQIRPICLFPVCSSDVRVPTLGSASV
jgi:hypothetical protein